MRKQFIYNILLCAVLTVTVLPDIVAGGYGYSPLYGSEAPRSRSEMGITLAGAYMFMQPDVDLVRLNPRIGVRGALSMAICWHESYALQMELAYLYNKIEAQLIEQQYDVKSGIVEIPIMFSYRGVKPLRFNAGLTLSLAGTGRYDQPQERIEFGRLRPTLGFVAGVGVNLSRHVLLEARFTSSFSSTANYFEGVEFSSRSHWLTFGVGYMF